VKLPEKDMISELELLLRNVEWDDMLLECIFDPHQPRNWQWRKEEFGPVITDIRRLIGTPQDPEKITKPEELLFEIERWLQFTNVFSQDKSLKKIDCTILVRKGYELAKKVEVTLKEPPGPFSVSEAKFELEKIHEKIFGGFHHSPDYRSAYWKGEGFTFTPTEAEIVELLHKTWENDTPDLGQAYIIGVLEDRSRKEELSSNARVSEYFKGNPAWNTLIVKGKSKGTLRLNI
jgi:hypothetical protein